jgi:hypothetical protein
MANESEADRVNVSSPDAIVIPVHWGAADNLQTLYANQLFITRAGPEFYLVFGELVSPLAFNSSELPSSLEIKPIARIVVSPDAILKFSDVISKIVEPLRAKN